MKRKIIPLLSLFLVGGLFSSLATAGPWTVADSYCKDLDPSDAKKADFIKAFKEKAGKKDTKGTGDETIKAKAIVLAATVNGNFLNGVCKKELWEAISEAKVKTLDEKKAPKAETRETFNKEKDIDKQIETIRQYALDFKKVHQQLEKVRTVVDQYKAKTQKFTQRGGLETEADIRNLKALIPQLIKKTGKEEPKIKTTQPKAPQYGTLLFNGGKSAGTFDAALRGFLDIDRVSGQFDDQKWREKSWDEPPSLRMKFSKIKNKLENLDLDLADRLGRMMKEVHAELWTVNNALMKAVKKQREALEAKNVKLKAKKKNEVAIPSDTKLFNEQLDQLGRVRKKFRADLLDEIGRRNYELLKKSDEEGGTKKLRKYVAKYDTYAKFKAAHISSNDYITKNILRRGGGDDTAQTHLKFTSGGHEVLYTKGGKTHTVLLPENLTGGDEEFYDLSIKKIADLIIEDREPKRIRNAALAKSIKKSISGFVENLRKHEEGDLALDKNNKKKWTPEQIERRKQLRKNKRIGLTLVKSNGLLSGLSNLSENAVNERIARRKKKIAGGHSAQRQKFLKEVLDLGKRKRAATSEIVRVWIELSRDKRPDLTNKQRDEWLKKIGADKDEAVKASNANYDEEIAAAVEKKKEFAKKQAESAHLAGVGRNIAHDVFEKRFQAVNELPGTRQGAGFGATIITERRSYTPFDGLPWGSDRKKYYKANETDIAAYFAEVWVPAVPGSLADPADKKNNALLKRDRDFRNAVKDAGYFDMEAAMRNYYLNNPNGGFKAWYRKRAQKRQDTR